MQSFALKRGDKVYSNRDLKKLLIPLIIEQVLSSLMGTADTMMVSRVGSAAISGVSLVDSINKLVIFLFTALATGGTIICSQYLGRQDKADSDKAARQVLLSSFVLSLAVTAFCFVSYKWLLRVIFGRVEQSVMDAAVSYFYITIYTYPFVALFGAASAIFRASGNTRLSMIISVSCNMLNIIGNALLIFGLNMGVAGAALATLISNVIAAIVILICLARPGGEVNIGKLTAIRPDFRMIWLVLCVGLPTGIENAMFQFGKLIVQSTVSTLGTAAIAANAMVVVLELFTSMPSQAIGLGLVTVAGQCIGAGRLDEARFYTKKLTVWSAVILLICNWLIFFITRPVTRLAGMDPAAADMTVSVMLVISIVKPILWPMSFTPCNGTRAAGDVKFNMVVSSLSMWVFRVGLTTVLCRLLNVGLIGIWCGYFADWGVRSIIFTIRFHGDKWHSHKLIDE